MQKPNGYDEAQQTGEYVPIELGGHYCIIKQVSEKQSSTGKDMIVVLIDFCKPDKQADYFATRFNNDTRADYEKKWPFSGTKYIMVNDYEDPTKTSRQFKTFCTLVEKSNNYQIQWGGDNWAQQFKGKKIGAVYGEEEHEYEGRISMREVLKWFCSWDYVPSASTPAAKYLSNSTKSTTGAGNQEIPSSPEVDAAIPF